MYGGRFRMEEMFKKIMERFDQLDRKMETKKQVVHPLDGDKLLDNTVEYGVGDCALSDHVVPLLYRHLQCDHCGVLVVSIFYDLHHDAAPLRVEGLHAEVVEYEQIGAFYAFEFAEEGSSHLCYL